jgi:molybdate transport system substrate-binding protein
MKTWLNSIGAISVVAGVLTLQTAAFGQVRVIISGGFSAAYGDALPAFERATGINIVTTSGPSVGDGPNTIGAQLRRGVAADVVILSREGLNELIAERRIVAGTETDLAQVRLGVAVRVGSPKPDISTVEAFKRTLLRAKGVFASGTTGVYLTSLLFPRLGIATEMSGKITTSNEALARGDAELAVQPVSELLGGHDVNFIGLLPQELQKLTVYAAAVVASSKEVDAAKKLIAFLASQDAAAAIENHGMERPLR